MDGSRDEPPLWNIVCRTIEGSKTPRFAAGGKNPLKKCNGRLKRGKPAQTWVQQRVRGTHSSPFLIPDDFFADLCRESHELKLQEFVSG
jgi:hypothetical protein